MDELLQLGLSNALGATLLAVLVAGIGCVCRRPALRHGLWLLVLIKLVTPSFVPYRLVWLDKQDVAARAEPGTRAESELLLPAEPQAARIAMAEITSVPAPSIPQVLEDPPSADTAPEVLGISQTLTEPSVAEGAATNWWTVIGGIWLTGSVCWFSFVVWRLYRFQRLLRGACPAPADLSVQAQGLAGRLGLVRCPALGLLPGRLSPMAWALLGRPRILLPSALWQRLTVEQQATLLVHELAHLRRRDQWVRGLELIVLGLYWWHPIAWWACREIHAAEEYCCDAWVLAILPRAGRAYATALLETIDFLSETPHALPVVASGIGQVHDLRRRLTMIMHGKTPRALSGAGVLLLLGLGAFLLPLRPTWGQDQPASNRPANAAERQRRIAESAQARAEEELQAAQALEARDQWETLHVERQKLTAELERMKAQLDAATANFKRAEARLAELQNRERDAGRNLARQQAEPPRPRTVRGRSSEQPGAGAPEHRLEELERKLDALIQEVQNLRREMRRSNLGVPSTNLAPTMPPAPAPANRPRREGLRTTPPAAPAIAPVPPTPEAPVVPSPLPAISVAPAAPAAPTAPVIRPSAPNPRPNGNAVPTPAPTIRDS